MVSACRTFCPSVSGSKLLSVAWKVSIIFTSALGGLSALLQRPGLMDDLNDVFTKLFLQLAEGWFSIATHVAIKHSHSGRFLRDDLCQFGIALPDVHQNQRYNQPIENHHSLLHCAAEAGIRIMNPQLWQDAAADYPQPNHPKQTQGPDDERSGNEQKKFKHG